MFLHVIWKDADAPEAIKRAFMRDTEDELSAEKSQNRLEKYTSS